MPIFTKKNMPVAAIYTIYLQHPSVTTDSRNIQPGDLFFALKGPSFNGNQFALKALQQGAAYAIIDEKEYFIDDRTILVDDVLHTLQELAKMHRQQFHIPFIAITGSNGKTTSKELVHAVLSSTYKTYTTAGNLNNHIGIPLTILKIRPDAEIAIIEMGANHQKEIEGYCMYTMPTHGVIVNCGKAHLEGFGGEEGVKKGKGELYTYLRENDGVAFVMWDYDYLREMSKGITKIITYGSCDAAINGTVVESEPFLSVGIINENFSIQSHLVGAYNFPNILLAVTIGKFFNVSKENIKTAIENYIPSNSRSQLIEKGTNKIILDAYNANPSSMKLAIENIAKLDAQNKVLILGAMAELGTESIHEHEAIVDLIGQYKWKDVVLVGGDFLKIRHPYRSFDQAEAVASWFREQDFKNSYILIKGSRSAAMEKVLAN